MVSVTFKARGFEERQYVLLKNLRGLRRLGLLAKSECADNQPGRGQCGRWLPWSPQETMSAHDLSAGKMNVHQVGSGSIIASIKPID
jgi:hypothetical protein